MKRNLPRIEKIILLSNGFFGFIPLTVMIIGIYLSIFSLKDIYFNQGLNDKINNDIGLGQVMEIYATNNSLNGEYYFGYEYIFHSPRGDLKGLSYQLGDIDSIGSIVNIEYNSGNPNKHRIQGMTNSITNNYLLWNLLLFIFGLIIFIVIYLIGKSKLNIILNGNLVIAKLVGKKDTYSKQNNRKVYKMTFRFLTDNKRKHRISLKTTYPQEYESNRLAKVIYLEKSPNKAVIVDSLPQKVAKYIYRNWS